MKKLLEDINFMKDVMISVATDDGMRIQEINEKYKGVFVRSKSELKRLGIDNPNTYSDLWEWYGKWSSGEMPRYIDRRTYIIKLFKPIIEQIENYDSNDELEVELTGWDRIERTVEEIRIRIIEAQHEEQFQAIGVLCRDVIISLAQEVYDVDRHPSEDDTIPSSTDSNRMLAAYIFSEMPGSQNEALRKYAKATNTLANELTHKRSATMQYAKICSSATISLINLFRILEVEN